MQDNTSQQSVHIAARTFIFWHDILSHLLKSCIHDSSNLADLRGVLHVLLKYDVLRVFEIVSRFSRMARVRRYLELPDLSRVSRNYDMSGQRDLLHTFNVNTHLRGRRHLHLALRIPNRWLIVVLRVSILYSYCLRVYYYRFDCFQIHRGLEPFCRGINSLIDLYSIFKGQRARLRQRLNVSIKLR